MIDSDHDDNPGWRSWQFSKLYKLKWRSSGKFKSEIFYLQMYLESFIKVDNKLG